MTTPCLDREKEQYVLQFSHLPKEVIHVVQLESQDGPVLKTRLEELERVQDVFYNVPEIQLSTFWMETPCRVRQLTIITDVSIFMNPSGTSRHFHPRNGCHLKRVTLL